MDKAYGSRASLSMREACRKGLSSGKGPAVRPFAPEVGRIYENRGGGFYRCMGPAFCNGCCAVMENIRSGWRLTAHDIVQYEDGLIEWAFSTSGRFVR